MIVLLAGAAVGAIAGAGAFGLPGAILGACIGTMLAAVVMLNRE